MSQLMAWAIDPRTPGTVMQHRRRQAKRSSSGPPIAARRTVKLLHVRSSNGDGGSGWAKYARAARQAARLSQAALATKMGNIARNTISRWELGQFRPDSPDDVVRFARATGVDAAEALAAAGFRPDTTAPSEPSRPADPEIDLIRASKLSRLQKEALIRHVLERRAREQQTRLAELEMIVRAQERGR